MGSVAKNINQTRHWYTETRADPRRRRHQNHSLPPRSSQTLAASSMTYQAGGTLFFSRHLEVGYDSRRQPAVN